MGFEPMRPGRPPALKAGAIVHSATPPQSKCCPSVAKACRSAGETETPLVRDDRDAVIPLDDVKAEPFDRGRGGAGHLSACL